jgi:hypothetical protein
MVEAGKQQRQRYEQRFALTGWAERRRWIGFDVRWVEYQQPTAGVEVEVALSDWLELVPAVAGGRTREKPMLQGRYWEVQRKEGPRTEICWVLLREQRSQAQEHPSWEFRAQYLRKRKRILECEPQNQK